MVSLQRFQPWKGSITEPGPEILGVDDGASRAEIKKAYHKAALTNHPDKVPESERAEADLRFKQISKAYEILYDDDKRHLYDTHGMDAFEGGGGAGPGGVDLDDILAQMMGDMGGGGPFGSRNSRPSKPRKAKDEVQPYTVSLEDLYKSKTVKFAATKNIICTHCKGSGGKEKATPKRCSSCRGQGVKQILRTVGPGLVTQETVVCGNCHGKGSVYNQKDRCKKCHGETVVQSKKVLELYIPRGSKEGEKIRLEGEADQVPGQEPGDLVFILKEQAHSVFERRGADLKATLEVTLAEALCGFSRVVIKHLDGRGLHMQHPTDNARVLEPNEVLKISGEGMPAKKTDAKGDLYLVVKVLFPDYAWLEKQQAFPKLRETLPGPSPPILTDEVDDINYSVASATGAFEDESADAEGWEDDDGGDDDEMGGAQCQQQ